MSLNSNPCSVAGRRYQVTSELLDEVAAVLATNPSNKAKAVAEYFDTSERNASRWIAACRKLDGRDRPPPDGEQFVQRRIEAKICASRKMWAQEWISLRDFFRDSADRLGGAAVPTPLRYVSQDGLDVKIKGESDGSLTLVMSAVVRFESMPAVSA